MEAQKENENASPEILDAKTSEPASQPMFSLQQMEEKQSETEETAPRAVQEEEIELLTFYLAGEEYAVDIMTIQEITKFMEVTSVPRVPSYIKGIVTLRGNVIPVFDMHCRLHLAPFQRGGKSRFIISSLTEGTAAMMVDEITDVVRLKKSRLEVPPSGIATFDDNFIEKIGRIENRLLILLNINEVLKMNR